MKFERLSLESFSASCGTVRKRFYHVLPTLPLRIFTFADPEYQMDENTALRTAWAFCIEKLLSSTLAGDSPQIQ